MLIGVDARALCDLPLSGVGEYAKNLVEILPTLENGIEFRFFSNQNPHIPSKILNSLFRANIVKLEYLVGKVDRFFLPNHIFFSTKRPYIITVHDLSFHLFPEFYNPKTRLWHHIVSPRTLYRNAEKIIAVSESTKQDLVNEFQLPKEKIHVIYSGIGKEFLHFSTSKEEKENFQKKYHLPERFILFLGTQEKRKNILGMIQAFEILLKKREEKDLFLVLAGKPGFGFQEILRYVKRSKAAPMIRFLGYIPQEVKPILLHTAEIFLYPSFYEGFGFPPLEAMAVGTPVVVSHTPSLVETTRGGAIAVSPRDPEEMAHALSMLLEDSNLRDIMIQKGKEVAAQYSWEECARKTLEVIKT